MANYNVSWFEANFNAYPSLKEDEYKLSKKQFKQYITGQKPTFEEFCDKFKLKMNDHDTCGTTYGKSFHNSTNRLLNKLDSRKNKNHIDQLFSIYKYSKNIHEFIQKVDKCNNALYRIWLVNLIDMFFTGLLFKQ